MQGVAKKYNLYEQTQFETEVIRAIWDESIKQWQIELKSTQNKEIETRYYDFM
jgi:cation diffusion facilitator CzcD-associated flavoprotein CzcO